MHQRQQRIDAIAKRRAFEASPPNHDRRRSGPGGPHPAHADRMTHLGRQIHHRDRLPRRGRHPHGTRHSHVETPRPAAGNVRAVIGRDRPHVGKRSGLIKVHVGRMHTALRVELR